MRILRPTAPAVAAIVLLALAACASPTATPTPTTSGTSTTPTPGATEPTPLPEDVEVTAAVVVVTATTTSVLGTDGSTLASVNYTMDGAAAAALIAEALDAEPVETVIPEIGGGPCPEARSYDFGGLVLRSPGSLWTQSSIEVIVTTATTVGGVEIETLGGQQIGATQPAFQAAVGDFMVLYDTATVLGFDIVNPEADQYSRVGAYAEFVGGELDYLAAPNILGFIGSCA